MGMKSRRWLKIVPLAALVLISAAMLARAAETTAAAAGRSAVAAQSQAPSPAVVDPTSVQLGEFAWLEGRWRGEWGPRIAEQVWFSPKAGAMEGMFRVIEGEKTLVVEYFTLVQKPDGIALYTRHFTPSLAPWEKSDATLLNLSSADSKKFEFQNAVNGMPKVSSLTRLDADTYMAHAEIVPETGDPQIVEITYHRQAAAANPPASGGSGAHQKKP
jgi:uncharacterized protein DUF6265